MKKYGSIIKLKCSGYDHIRQIKLTCLRHLRKKQKCFIVFLLSY